MAARAEEVCAFKPCPESRWCRAVRLAAQGGSTHNKDSACEGKEVTTAAAKPPGCVHVSLCERGEVATEYTGQLRVP
jgi:hypothetical protein